MDKQNVVHPYNEILFGNKKEWRGLQFSGPLCKELHSNNKLKVELLKNQLFQICHRSDVAEQTTALQTGETGKYWELQKPL